MPIAAFSAVRAMGLLGGYDALSTMLIATTNDIGANAHETLAAQEKPVGLVLREDLLRAKLRWPTTGQRLSGKTTTGTLECRRTASATDPISARLRPVRS